MRSTFFKFLGYALLSGLAILLLFVFWPRHYDVPLQQPRSGTQYWNLSTGSRIAYTVLQPKEPAHKTPVIYLHGGPGGPIYDRNIELLKPLAEDGYTVYLYDQVGGGFSDRLTNIEDYSVERHKRDLEAIVQEIGAEKVILIGQSWGAILATVFAADNPDKIEKIVFASPGPIQPQNRELASLKAPDSLGIRAPTFSNAQGNAQANNLRTKATAYCAMSFGIKLESDEEADNFAVYLGSLTNRSLVCDTSKIPKPQGGSGYYVQVMTIKSIESLTDPRPKLRLAPYPVLVMKGQCDNQKWGYTHEYLHVFPHHQLVVIPDAGHSIPLEQPDLYIQIIRNFLKH